METKTADFSNLKVWVAEDDLPSWGVVSRLLEALGVVHFTVSTKTSVILEAIQKGFEVDVLLLDVHLKDGSGYDLLQAVQQNPQYAHTHCIMVSATSGPGGIREAQEAHADGFISKPLTLDKLRRALTSMLEGNQFWE